MENHTVFISHAHADNAVCDPYASALSELGLDVWYDRANMDYAQLISEVVGRELQKRSVFIVFLTPNSVTSAWVQLEIATYLSYWTKDPKGRVILPVMLSECEVPPLLHSFKWIDAWLMSKWEVVAAIAGALGVEMPTGGPGPEQKHSQELDFGVIGYGYWGPRLVRNLSALPDCSVRIIADLDDDRRAQARQALKGPGLTFTKDVREIFISDMIDAVVIATPVASHYSLTKQALLARKHVYVEKPFVTRIEEAEELVALAHDRGLVLMVGYTFLYHNAVRELRRILHEGDLGKLFYIEAQRLNLGLIRRDNNVIWDLASHDLAILHYLLDADPISVQTIASAHVIPGVEDIANVHVRYGDNVRYGANSLAAHLQFSWLYPRKVCRYTLIGDQRMAIFDDQEVRDWVHIYNKGVDYTETDPQSSKGPKLTYRFGADTTPYIEFAEPLRVAVEEFARCIRTGEMPLTDGEWSLPITRALVAIERSLKLGGQEVSAS